jgi:hypothetical protein
MGYHSTAEYHPKASINKTNKGCTGLSANRILNPQGE